MKYTTKIKEAQYAGGIKLNPSGGTVTKEQAKAILSDPWGKKLFERGMIAFDEAIEIPTKPKLGMTVEGGVIKGTNTAKTELKNEQTKKKA